MIQHREEFLETIGNSLKRTVNTKVKPQRNWKYAPQKKGYQGLSQDDLLEILEKQCDKIHTDVVTTTVKDLPNALEQVVDQYGGGPISMWQDSRFDDYNLKPLYEEKWPNKGYDVSKWFPELGEQNIQNAEKANIGLTFSEYVLAESGTVVLFSDQAHGKSVGLLPNNFIAIVKKSMIVPRMTQVAELLNKRIESGESLPSAIDFVSGPSNSADIEMKLVVGVHGPIHATYIILMDE
ncbi:LutC/YkgG family protein [Rummeliibacillus pycnus]|uniref:LutC/YkgG family protein n=1 Tax=Rummeliibacillus pycnus TaxID=101070 RepID=UPI000C9AD3EF|nr:lactate utilization protein C [Rummeliibacillus pycnus]